MQYELFEMPVYVLYELSFMISPIDRIKGYVKKQKNFTNVIVGDFKSKYYPAHISLGKTLKREDQVEETLENAKMSLRTFHSFTIDFYGFDIFPQSNTIFVEIVDTSNIISVFHAIFKGKPRKPHMTIAEALNDEQFFHAWKHFQNQEYKDQYLCDHILILRREYGSNGRWEKFDKILLL